MNPAPCSVDVQDILFKQSSIQQISEDFSSSPPACSLLATDGKRGLIYIGHNNKLTILKSDNISSEWKIELELPYSLCRLALSCDCSYLAVSTPTAGTLIYNANVLSKNNLELLQVVTLSTSQVETFVRDLQWNPTIPDMLCIVDSNNSIGNLQLKGDKMMLTPGPPVDALCAAWSPKGKQIVLGCQNGNILQCKPDFKLVRTINGPVPSIGKIIALRWISNYQFCAAYLEPVERRINVLIIDAPKGDKNVVFTYYEDITYGMPDADGTDSLPRYYLEHIQEWNLIIAASSRSSEVAMLGSTDNGATWRIWTPDEGSRAELPLKSRKSSTESYPVGVAIDRSSVEKLPWGPDSYLPYPVPKLHVLGTSGQLCSFHIINLFPNSPAICSRPTEIVQMQISRPSIVPSEISFALPNATATSTPRPKQTVMVTENVKVVPTANLFGGVNSNEIASAKSSGFSSTTDSKQLPKPHVNQFQPSRAPSKVDETIAPINETPGPSQESADKKDNDSSIDESIRMRAYAHVQSLFEKELRSRMQQQTWDCGTTEERTKLMEKCATMDEFLRELRETTNGLSSDIAYLKALLLQTFAWVEETKSKNTVSTNITPRKHGDTGKIAELKRLYYYTQSQLSQATKVLDLEWSDQKAYERMKMKIPSTEYLYQTLMKHNKIIAEEKRKIEYFTKKWKMLSRTSGISGLNNSMSHMRLTAPTPTVQYSGDVDIIEARCKAIALRTLNFTYEKQTKLRNTLSRSTPRIIKPVNPSPIQDRLEATLSSLASTGTVTTEIKQKTETLTNKQITTNNTTSDAKKSQSPLTSLTNIVARIGSSEGNDTQTMVKSQNKVNATNGINNTFTVSCGNKYPQLDKKNSSIAPSTAATVTVSGPLTTSSPVTPSTTLRNKDKQEFTTFNQPSISSTITSGIKAFPKVDSISFGLPSTKAQDFGQTKLPSKELTTTNDSSSPVTLTNEGPKVDSNLFANISLKDTVLSTGMLSSKTQSGANGNLSMSTATLKPTDVSTTFSFATSNTVASLIKTPVAEPATTLPSSNAQVFSFASKSPNAFSFTLKPNTTSATPVLSQGPLDMTGLSLRLQPTDVPNTSIPGEKATTTNETTFTSSTISFDRPPSSTMSVPRVPSTTASQSTPSTVANISITPISTPVFSKPAESAAAVSTPFVGSSPQVSSSTSSMFSGTQQTTVTSAPPFGQAPSSTPPTTAATIFGSVTSISSFGTSSAAPTFSRFSGALSTAGTTLSSVPLSTATALSSMPPSMSIALSSIPSSTSITTSIGGASPAFASSPKPAFGDLTKMLSTTGFTGTTITSTSSITLGTVNSADTSPAVSFEKVSLSTAPTNTQFSTTGNSLPIIFGRTATTGSAPFAEPLKNTSVFGDAATTSSPTTIFGGGSNSSIFGGKTAAGTTPNIFGNNATTPTSVFGGTSNTSVFKSNTGKPGLIFGGNTTSSTAASPFGNVASGTSAAPNTGMPSPFGNVASGTSTAPNTGVLSPFANVASGTPVAPNSGVSSPFGNVASSTAATPNTGASSMGSSPGLASPQSAFGGAPTFGSKPAFGSPSSVFGESKPAFGSGFGSTTFGVPSTPGGFGSPPSMGGSSPLGGTTMTKVFGGTTGSNTFESLADQAGGLTFGSLAQKSPESQKPPPFSGGSSFSSWR